jgi:hypothetical protein
MIPESGENSTVDLYVCKDFPSKWEKVKTLLNGKYSDPTVFNILDNYYLFLYDEANGFKGTYYQIDFNNMNLIEINTVVYERNTGRSAGNFIKKEDGHFLRPSQKSCDMYGKTIIFKDVYFLNGEYKEVDLEEIDTRKIIVDNKKGVDRVHTYSISESYECVDYNYMKFDLLKRFKIIRRKKMVNRRNKDEQNKKTSKKV